VRENAFTRTQRTTGLLFVLITSLTFAWVVLRPLFAPLVVAVLIAVVFQPVHRLVERYCGEQTVRATLLSALLMLALVALPGFGLGVLFLHQAQSVIEQLAGEGSVEGRLVQLLHQYLTWMAEFLKKVGYSLNVEQVAREWTTKANEMLYDGLPNLLGGLGIFGLFLVVTLVMLFVLLYRGRDLKELIVELSPMEEGHTRQILGRLEITIQALFLGAFLTAIFQGLIGGLGFWLTGFDNWVVWGVMIGCSSFVPFIGTGLVWGPAVIYLATSNHGSDAMVLLLVGLTISTVDNVLRTLLIHGHSAVHPVLIFFSLIGGIKAIGPMGLIYGPLLAGCLVEAINIYRSDLLLNPAKPKPPPPVETEAISSSFDAVCD
jgi:predicted PurR-regulated permease PerM